MVDARRPDPFAMRPARRAFWIAVILVLIVDLVGKRWVFDWLDAPAHARPGGPYGRRVWLIPGLLRLSACVNDGAAFGMGSGATMALVAVTALLGPILVLIAYSCRAPSAPLWTLGAVTGGALGNLYDRMFLHGVRDFLEITHPGTHNPLWAIFNFADIGITGGVLAFLFWTLFLESRAAAAPAGEGGATGNPP